MNAQNLYDRRDEFGEIDGRDLHALFEAVCGEPSPAGRTPIDATALAAYAAERRATYAAHVASGGVGGRDLLDVADFCEARIA